MPKQVSCKRKMISSSHIMIYISRKINKRAGAYVIFSLFVALILLLSVGNVSDGSVDKNLPYLTREIDPMSMNSVSSTQLIPKDRRPFPKNTVLFRSGIVGGKNRSPSDPFITGDGFRDLATVVFDETTISKAGILEGNQSKTISLLKDALKAATGTSAGVPVFVQTHFLDLFIDEGFLSSSIILSPIILITHNSDYSAPWEKGNVRAKNGIIGNYKKQRTAILDSPLVSSWYAQNPVINHQKIFPIPIGIENRYNKFGQFAEQAYMTVYRTSVKPMNTRVKLLLVSFSTKTNPTERVNAMAAAQKLERDRPGSVTFFFSSKSGGSKIDVLLRRIREFLEEAAKHQFVLSPRGHGVDTHRTWEALYMGCIPIVTPSPMDERLLRSLPVMILSDNNFAKHLSYMSLIKAAEDLGGRNMNMSLHKLLNMEYWREKLALPGLMKGGF